MDVTYNDPDEGPTKTVLAGDLPRIAPGVYFGLGEETYHADPALGSTDIRRLRHQPFEWYWHSAYNAATIVPDDPPKQWIDRNDSRRIGTAIHLAVLSGLDVFKAVYARRPEHILKMSEKAAHAVAPRGQLILAGDTYDRVLLAATMIRSNRHLGDAFGGGFSEVSVFWEHSFEGRVIPLKARFDYLRQRATVDLKSIRNTKDVPFVEACRRRIADARYDIQAAHYNAGRHQMRRLAGLGMVHGCPSPDLLERIVAVDEWAFVLLFYQPDGAPLTWATSLSPANPILHTAARQVETALMNYVTHAETFGFGVPWLIASPVEELDVNDLPAWAWK